MNEKIRALVHLRVVVDHATREAQGNEPPDITLPTTA